MQLNQLITFIIVICCGCAKVDAEKVLFLLVKVVFLQKSNYVTIVTIRKNAEVAAEKNEAAESNAANTLFL